MTSSDEVAPDRRRLYILLAVAGAIAVVVAIIWWPRGHRYPAVASEESLGLMRLLYSACNAKDAERLTLVEERLAKMEADGRLTAAEKKAFTSIISQAKSGKWDEAEKAAFRFAQDQVGRGHAAPPEPSN